jgi:hypothetical protein
MQKENSNPPDYGKMIKEQKLIKIGEHPEEDENTNNNQYTPLPEGINGPGQMYDQIFPDYSKKDKPDWLKQTMLIEASSLEDELPPNRGL